MKRNMKEWLVIVEIYQDQGGTARRSVYVDAQSNSEARHRADCLVKLQGFRVRTILGCNLA